MIVDLPIKNKRVLITGINGFIGNYLSQRLSKEGALVYGISDSIAKNNIYKITVTNYNELDEFIRKEKIHIIFHLAAKSLVEDGQSDPYKTFQTNINGTLTILELARKHAIEKVILASTAHVYGDNKLPYREEYTPKPSRPYETSKACADLIAQSYADNFSLPVLIARFVNIYGPGDLHFTRLIPKTIKSIIENEPPKMWGVGTIRDYLYIDDAMDALIALAYYPVSQSLPNRFFNFGVGNKVSVEDIIQKLIKLSRKNIYINKISQTRAQEISAQYVSWEKAKTLLHWKPKYTLDEGLQITYSWYEDYFKRTMHI